MKGIWVFLHHQRIIYTPKRINNASECRSSSGGFAVQAFLTTPTTTPTILGFKTRRFHLLTL